MSASSTLSHFFFFSSSLFILIFFTLSWLQPTSSPSRSPSSDAPELAQPFHPLDPLTVLELRAARSIVLSHPPFSSSPSSTAFHSLSLDPPDKLSVLSWSSGDPLPPRLASAVVRFNFRSYSLSVDLSTGTLSFLPVPASGFPSMTIEDMTASASAPLFDLSFNRSLAARGVQLSDVTCIPISSGFFGGEMEAKRRLVKVQCYSSQGTANFYMRPIEGLTALVDLDTKEVVEISDVGRDIPVPGSAGTEYRYDGASTISIEQKPLGRSFEVLDGGHRVRWAGWEFHIKADARAGLVVSAASIADPATGKRKSVLYKGHASELFVPYMDPTDAWYFKTYMDAGEYGLGLQAMPLLPLNDCPSNSYYIDGVFVTEDGRPYVRKNMICIFESYAGDIAWRHSESPITGLPVI